MQSGVMDRKAEAAANEVVEAYKTLRFSCINCGSAEGPGSMFMVKDQLWDAVVGESSVRVCLPCFETVIGREVIETDLKRDSDGNHLPINTHILTKNAPLAADSADDRAKSVAENENYYASLLQRSLNATQKERLAKIESGEAASGGTAHFLRSDPVKDVRRRQHNQMKQNSKRRK